MSKQKLIPLQAKALLASGNSYIIAPGGFQWETPVYIGSGAKSAPDCTHNSTLTIVGDSDGLLLWTYFNITANAYGFLSVTGTLDPRMGSLTAVSMVRTNSTSRISLVSYGHLIPAETTKNVVDGLNICKNLNAIWTSLQPSPTSATTGDSYSGDFGPAPGGGMSVHLARRRHLTRPQAVRAAV